MPIPHHFAGKHATITSVIAVVVRTMRKDNGQTQKELASLLAKSRGQINALENNTYRGRNGWTLEDVVKLDMAWNLPLGTVALRCIRTYQQLCNEIAITDSRLTTSDTLSVNQLHQVLSSME